jgi:hypothetical protein
MNAIPKPFEQIRPFRSDHSKRAGRAGLSLLILAIAWGCGSEPIEPAADVERTGTSFIRLDMAVWEEPGPRDILLMQNGSLVAIDVVPDAAIAAIDIIPDTPLDPTAPYEILMAPVIERAMVPYGPLWITAGDPDCDTSLELQVDADEDGIPDCHEKSGTYHWGMPLHYWGARPNQVDVFVEVRYLEDEMNVARPWMRPWPQALDKVRDEFAANGYVVHFDVGDLYEGNTYAGYEQGVDWSGEFNLNDDDHGFDFATEIVWVTPEADCNTVGACAQDATGWDSWTSNDNFLTSYVSAMMKGRDRSFYFVLFANSADGPNSSASGRSHNGGRNAVVTLGQLGSFTLQQLQDPNTPHNLPATATEQSNKIINYQAAVLMHEMGHMFGLREGGDWQLQGKPNYMSTMSYVHMFTGLPLTEDDLQIRHQNYQHYYVENLDCDEVFLSSLANGPLGDPSQFHIGYSDGNVAPLDESSLDESSGIGMAPWQMSDGIDWNCNGSETDMLVDYNITYIGFYPNIGVCGTSMIRSDDELVDYDDWGNLELYHREHFVSGEWPNAGLPFECAFPG